MNSATTHRCDSCGNYCGMDRYHCQECNDFDLCPACFSKKDECGQGHRWFSHEVMTDRMIKEKLLTRHALGVGPLIHHALRLYKTRPCIGFVVDPEAPPPRNYQFVTYDDIKKRSMQLLLGLHMRLVDIFGPDDARAQHNYDPDEEDTPIRIGIFTRNSPAFVVADVACALGGFISVPMDPHSSKEALTHILSITGARVVVVDEPHAATLATVIASTAFPALRLVVLLEKTDVFSKQPNVPEGLMVLPHDQLLQGLQTKYKDFIAELTEKDYASLVEARVHSDTFTLIFTSGSTGRPKGAIQTHKIWIQDTFELDLYANPYVTMVYRPLCYATDREVLWRSLSNGGRVVIFSSDMSTIFDDLRTIGPTGFSGPPRVWNVLYDRFNKELAKRIAHNKDPNITKEKIRSQLSAEYSDLVGPRCKSIGIGGAAPRPEVVTFMRQVFENDSTLNRVYESYGTTENGGITINDFVHPSAQVMLIDVPEMGFFVSNNPPQGEVCVITRDAIPGYWRDEDNTNKLFYTCDKGKQWIRTGDIGEFRGKQLHLIDRRGNVVKLANSTFISPETLESVFINCASVHDVFVYAESSWEFPLAVVTLANPNSGTSAEQTQATVLAEMRAIAVQRDVQSTHVPHALLIEPEWFTVENKGLTISLKTARANLKLRYQAQLRDLYKAIATPDSKPPPAPGDPQQQDDLEPFRRESSSIVFEHNNAGVDDAVDALQNELCVVIAKMLQHQRVAPTETPSGLGADSISIARIRARIRKMTNGVDIPVDTLWHSTISDLAKLIVHRSRETTSQTHLWDPRAVVRTDEKTSSMTELIKRLPVDSRWSSEDLLSDVIAKQANGERHLLLTGATGFVGSHILREVLMNQASAWTSVVCLVRGNSDDMALNRVVVQLIAVGVSDAVIQEVTSTKKLMAYACNLESLAELQAVTNIRTLRERTTHVIHASAGVNHVLPHSALAAANIGSTRALLAAFGSANNSQFQHFCFISTVSAVGLSQSLQVDVESLPMEQVPDLLLQRHTPSGYATTKWCSERLVVQATQDAKTCFVAGGSATASIVRLGMTGWCTETGVGNLNDWITALAASCWTLRAYPSAKTRLINVVPVDTVARALLYHCSGAAQLKHSPSSLLTVVHLVSSTTTDLQGALRSLANHSVKIKMDAGSANVHFPGPVLPPPAFPPSIPGVECTDNEWLRRLQEATTEFQPFGRHVFAAAALFSSAEQLPVDEPEHHPARGEALIAAVTAPGQSATCAGSADDFVAWCCRNHANIS